MPYADPSYYALRPRIAIRRDDVLQLDARTGLHPSLAPLMPLWKARELAIVQGVGYPNPNLSHFRSIEIWDTASRSEEYLADGWLARAFAAHAGAAQLRGRRRGRGRRATSARSPEPARAPSRSPNTEQFLRQARLAQPMQVAQGNRALAHLLKVEADVVQAASGLQGRHAFRTEFPQGPFGNAVRTRRAGRGEQCGRRGRAPQPRRLRHAPEPAGAACQPAAPARRRTRRLARRARRARALGLERSSSPTRSSDGAPQENGSNGTDHGTANVHFALGGRVKGGILGAAPRLDRLENGNLVHAVEFRSLYATVLERWWGVPSSGVLGGRFPALDLLRA